MLTREPIKKVSDGNLLAIIGRWVVFYIREIGRATQLLAEAVFYIPQAYKRRARREILVQMYVYGIKSLGVLTIVALFTGMILALQTGIELRRFDQEVNIGTAVMVSMLREMGPFMTGLILAACVGSAMAAQIGTMVVSEEIAALEIMAINPVRFLVMPRLIAMAFMTPLMSFYTCVMGILGGGLVGMTQLGVSWGKYIDNATLYATTKDFHVGLLKAFLFGVVITVVSCYEGFSTAPGALGVGQATRRAVIVSFLLILVVGYFVTRLFYV